MKVAFVTSWLSQTGGGGVASAIEGMSRALHRDPISVDVLGLADAAWHPDNWQGAPAHGFSVSSPRALGRSPQLRRSLCARAPDIVHSHGLWMHVSADVTAWAGLHASNPYLVAPHGMLDPWALSNSAFKKRIAGWLYEDRHLSGAACIHALCPAEADAIRTHGLTNPICVVPNGIELPSTTPIGRAPWADTFGSQKRILLFLGRLHPKKNVHGLLSAWANLKYRGRLGDWRLAIAGWSEGGYGQQLARQIEELKLNHDVIFLGPVHDARKAAALHHASAFVLPSFSEGLPVAVLEAWSYALPVAMTRPCNLACGYAAGAAHPIATDAAVMARNLEAFLTLDDTTLTEMGRSGRALVACDFTWDGAAAQLKDVYGWLLDGGARPDFVQ